MDARVDALLALHPLPSYVHREDLEWTTRLGETIDPHVLQLYLVRDVGWALCVLLIRRAPIGHPWPDRQYGLWLHNFELTHVGMRANIVHVLRVHVFEQTRDRLNPLVELYQRGHDLAHAARSARTMNRLNKDLHRTAAIF